jgi:hypothetical protein
MIKNKANENHQPNQKRKTSSARPTI